MEVENFVSKTLELLQEEKEAEFEETRSWQENLSLKDLQNKGVCLLKLRVGSRHTGMNGRLLVAFESRRSTGPPTLPSNTFGPGDITGLYGSDSPTCLLGSGVVTRVTHTSITVAFDDTQDNINLETGGLYNLMKLTNDVTYRRLTNALKALNNYSGGPASHLISVLFGYSEPGTLSHQHALTFSNNGLDDSQKEAVSFALSQKDVAVIHGPPGTGKTTTVVEVILQAVKREEKVLCCAPSNVAVDNLVERLARSKLKVLRLGHPARLLESIQKHSLDAVLAHSDDAAIICDIRKDIDKAFNEMKKSREKGQRGQLRREVGELRRELRTREKTAITQILKRAEVILATTTGASDDGPLKHLPDGHFDLVVIDECAQALESSCWIALLKAHKCVLAGDHKQLPPTIKSQSAATKGLSVTLMEKVMEKHGDSVVRMLTTQYRMHRSIMQWASEQMYQGKLAAHPSVEKHLLRDLEGVEDTEDTRIPLLLIDTAGCGLNEMEIEDKQSKGNEGEVDIVALHVKALTEAGLQAKDIAVVAPYNLQVDLLRQKLALKYPDLEMRSVDGFQGREKEAVVLSLVRSNRKGEVGFLAEDRRINVAVTRARRQLVLVCDSQTVRNHDFLKSLVDHMSEHGEVRSAFEYLDDCVPSSYSCEVKDMSGKDALKAKPKSKSGAKKVKEATNGREESQDDPHHWEDKLNRIKERLENFLKETEKKKLVFPASLTSRERLMVHQLSEEMGFHHESQGDGRKRYISVFRPSEKPQNPPEPPDTSESDSTQEPAEPQQEEALDLKQLHLERMRREQVKREEKKLKSSRPEPHQMSTKSQCARKDKSSMKGHTKLKAGASEIAAASSPEQDFDALIAAVVEADSRCGFVRCRESVRTLGQMCLHCNRLFCLSHHIPEVHGCGERAKTQARIRISKEGVLYAGSGWKDKSMDPTKKAHLQRKLDSKLKDMASQRKTKAKEEK